MTTTADHAAFLRAIIAEPAVDLHRLVFADWLEDHGEPERAEFIRCQIELANLPSENDNSASGWPGDRIPRSVSLRWRERELLAHQGWFAVSGLAQHYNPGTGEYGWLVKRSGENGRHIPVVIRRGFVAEITCRLSDWIGEECGVLLSECVVAVGRPFIHFNTCTHCHGSGRINAHGPVICREQPIERVVTERKPWGNWTFTGSQQNQYGFQRAETWAIRESYYLPPCIFDLLEGGEYSNRNDVVGFSTEAAALDALSDALLTWAKAPR